MAETKVLASGTEVLVYDYNEWVPLKGIKSLNLASNKTDVDTTDFDSNGRMEHIPCLLSKTMTIEMDYIHDGFGHQQVGQQRLRDAANRVGPNGLVDIEIITPAGKRTHFIASVNITSELGALTEASKFNIDLTVTGVVDLSTRVIEIGGTIVDRVDCGGQVENVKYLGNGKVLATRLDTKHYVLYSADYGLTWQGATFDVQPDLITCFENVGNGVVACGGYYSTGVPGAIYTSNDYGATWTRQWNTSAQGGIVALARANQNELYSVRTNGGTTIVDKMNTSDTGVNLGIDVNKKTQSTSAGGSIKFVTFGTQYGTLYFGDKQEWSGSASKLFKSVNTSHDSWAEVATGIGYLYNGISYDYNNEKVLALVETPAGAVYKFILLVTTTAELDTLVNIANSGAVGRNLEYIGKDKFIFSWQDEINTWKIGEASIATLHESGSYAFLTSCYLGTNQILLGTAESVEIKITNK